MFVRKLLRILLSVVSAFCALVSVYATVTALQGDDSAPAAAVFFGIVAVAAFALRRPVSWLADRAAGVITPPLRRAVAAIPRPRFPAGRQPPGILLAIIGTTRADDLGLFPAVYGADDPPPQWTAEEEAAERHMRAHGFPDAQLTDRRRDDGVDIVAKTAVARVTTQEKPVSVPMVRRLRDTLPDLASHLFYSTTGYTKITVATADKIGVSLFLITRHGTVEPLNAGAQRIST
ncbi:restriction endonuclease [Actinoplanes sp. NPDC049596]|uniref:restriction endonuclease n=1 Tax=unclassified Actinoplanes TaxID=2626549 RepID=UPI00342D2357